jgi:FkbM family methyltransferase
VNDRLYRRTKALGIAPTHVAEVGVYVPESSNVLGFIEDGCAAELVEPDPACLARLRERFAGYANVTIHPVAIHEREGRLALYQREASTFAKGLPSSPSIANDGYTPSDDDLFEVVATTFDRIDDGMIELLSIDTEGCEWYVLKTMRSRPAIISVEMGFRAYRNPFAAEIRAWLASNDYVLWYRDKSDSVFIRRPLRPRFWQRLRPLRILCAFA